MLLLDPGQFVSDVTVELVQEQRVLQVVPADLARLVQTLVPASAVNQHVLRVVQWVHRTVKKFSYVSCFVCFHVFLPFKQCFNSSVHFVVHEVVLLFERLHSVQQLVDFLVVCDVLFQQL